MPVFKRPHFKRLLELAKKGRIAPLYLFLGDPKVAQELSRDLVSTLSSQGLLTEEIDLFHKEDYRPLITALSVPSLLGRKILLAKGIEKIPSPQAQEICNLLRRVKNSHSLILLLEELPAKHPLLLFAEKEAVLIPLKKAHKASDFLQYEIPEMLANLGKKMDRRTGELLLELVGDDLAALRQEVEKLALYVEPRTLITPEDVKAVVSPRPEQAPFQLIDTLFSDGPERALGLLKQLVEQGTSYLVFVSILATFFKRLRLFQYVLKQKPVLGEVRYPLFKTEIQKALKEIWPDRTPKLLSVHPYVLYRLLGPAKLIPEGRVLNTLIKLAEIDLLLKSRPVSAPDLFYRLFWEIKGF